VHHHKEARKERHFTLRRVLGKCSWLERHVELIIQPFISPLCRQPWPLCFSFRR
jgi:hypothetical protein